MDENEVLDNPFGKPDHCRSCTLFREPGIVRGEGNRNAKIIYLGEAPGAEEVDQSLYYNPERHGEARANMRLEVGAARNGRPASTVPSFRTDRMRPFVGGSGRIRTVLLSHADLDKTVHLYTTNCVKCRPPNNRLPTPFEVATCAKFLIEEIEDINPNVIIAAGELALNVLTDKKKIGLWRGVPTAGPRLRPEVHSVGGGNGGTSTANGEVGAKLPYKVFPTWHPAFIMRQQYQWAFAVHDLVRAKAESRFPEIVRTPINIIRDASVARDGAAIRNGVRTRRAFTFDFETTGLAGGNSSILMCGIVPVADTSYVLDWTTGTIELFQEFLDDPTIEIIGQNILSFDLPFAEKKGRRIRWTNVFDTMVAFHLANSSYGQTSIDDQNKGSFWSRGTEKDLSFIASNHTDIEYWKSREAYGADLKGVCGLDTIATDRSAMHPVDGLKEELRRYDMLDLYYKHVLPVHPVLHRMSERGMNIDIDRAVRWSIALEQNADHLEAALKEGLGEPNLNLNSPQQLMKILYEDMGLPVQYNIDKKKGKRPTANAEALEFLAELAPENIILRSIVDIRHYRKMKATFIDPMILSGRVNSRFGVSKAANGRFNSQNPNAQNVPEDMRDIWIPDSPEHVLISADSSQIEWRNAMVLSGDPVGLELLASGVDNHRAVAAEALGIRLENVTDYERHAAKFIVYGLGYGRGAPSIAAGHNLDLRFVEQFIKKFFQRFRVFHAWREELPKLVHDQHYLANAWKRRRWWWTREVTEIYNYPASSTAADMMIEELLALDRELPKEATLRLTVHDEVLINCPKDIVRETVLCVRTHMQQPWPQVVEASRDPDMVKRFYPNGWFCPADVHVGANWKQCKSKDPADKAARASLEKQLGLQELL